MKFYLDKTQISSLASNTDVYKRGVKYYKEGHVADIDFSEKEQGDSTYCTAQASVFGNYDDYTVDVIFNKSGILHKYRCDCDAFGVWRGGCKHVIAVMLKLYDMNYETLLKSRLSRETSELLNIFEQQAFAEIDQIFGSNENNFASSALPEENLKIKLVPCLVSDYNKEPNLTFTVGRKRRYVVKSIFDFVTNVTLGKEASYGKGLTFVHKRSMFEPESAKLLDLLIREYDNYSQIKNFPGNSFYYAISPFNSKRLPLTKRGFDDFFDLYNGNMVDVDIYGLNKKIMALTDKLPDIQFDIAKTKNSVVISQASDKALDSSSINTYDGEKSRYIVHNDCIHRVSTDYFNTLFPLQNVMLKSGNKISFQKAEYGRLSTFLLPKLRNYNMVNENVDLSENFLEYELNAKAYLDANDGAVTCKLMFCYEETEINSLHRQDTVFTRNIVEEYRCKTLLQQMGFVTDETLDHYKLNGNDLIYDFYKSEAGLDLLKKHCEIFATDEFMNKSIKPSNSTTFGLRIDGGLMQISIDTHGFSREELLDIIKSYQVKKRFHRLKDGSFISLEEGTDSLGATAELISGLGLSDKDITNGFAELPKFRAIYAEQILAKNKELEAELNREFKKLTRDFQSYKDLEFDIPQTLENTLRSYQKEGFNWLKVLQYYGFGGILADDMGLGKTLQVITVLLSAKISQQKESNVERKPSLVVAPTSLIYNWENEINRFAPEIDVMTVAGAAAKRKETINANYMPDVYITTYDMLKRDVNLYAEMDFQFIIADEAQNIKNPLTQNAKSLKELKGETRFALTGTPIENSLSELWSIFDFVMPGYLFTSSKFSRHYETPIIKNDDENRSAELRHQTSPFILRRIKRDVLKELPDKIETTIFAEMPVEQKKIYTAYLLQAKGELEETIKEGKYNEKQIEILSKLTRLRQICCHPATFIDNYVGGSGKLDITLETIQSSLNGGHRILIFSQFTKMLSIIQTMLIKENIPFFYLDGSTPSKERLKMAEQFNQGVNQVFLISLKAGGTGLNLIGADVVIHYDPWWNPAVMDQAADRAHRFGQKRTVQVINIVAKDSIEEKIMSLQSKKKDLVDNVIEEGATFINKMSQNDIVDLFKE